MQRAGLPLAGAAGSLGVTRAEASQFERPLVTTAPCETAFNWHGFILAVRLRGSEAVCRVEMVLVLLYSVGARDPSVLQTQPEVEASSS